MWICGGVQVGADDLVREYQLGSKKALEKLIDDNMGIIYKIANKYKGLCSKGLEVDDLVNDGVIGLIIAAKNYKFDLKKKAKFITYAVYYIERHIHTTVNGHSTKEQANRKFYDDCISLNVPLTDKEGEDKTELVETLKHDEEGYNCIIEKEFMKKIRIELDEVMEKYLTLNERMTIQLLYGWNYLKDNRIQFMTLEEVGDILNLSGERVRQIRYRAFKKIKETEWWSEKGRYYAHEVTGFIFENEEDREKTFFSVEVDGASANTKKGHDFINKYFADLMGVI